MNDERQQAAPERANHDGLAALAITLLTVALIVFVIFQLV
jgi:hypothetical protein